ncbi:hypothetical protein E2C01_030616 [Portunus trituberculatus]|uniref:Uncharacterized protein n=1 Tax=Portunus trituberculatus TaxID=210409 RepID=A0A5B7ESG9_PORTR|nr:hypothetical protein [Portunus trituberculatus]
MTTRASVLIVFTVSRSTCPAATHSHDPTSLSPRSSYPWLGPLFLISGSVRECVGGGQVGENSRGICFLCGPEVKITRLLISGCVTLLYVTLRIVKYSRMAKFVLKSHKNKEQDGLGLYIRLSRRHPARQHPPAHTFIIIWPTKS